MSFNLAELAGDAREIRITWVLAHSLALGRVVEIRDCAEAAITISGDIGHRGSVVIEGSRRGREFSPIGDALEKAGTVTLDEPPAFIRPRLTGADPDAGVVVRLVGRRAALERKGAA